MSERVIIERLEFQGHCGTTAAERRHAQPIGVDLELEYSLAAAAETDNLERAVDYAKVAERIIEVGGAQECCLLETLAERLSAMLFAEFPVSSISLWVRKLVPPVTGVRGSVGVRLDRTRAAQTMEPHPSRFLVEQLPRLPKGTALDVATGRGRNALYLAAQGYAVEAVDRDEQALAEVAATARQRNLPNLVVRPLDFEADPDQPPQLPKERYDVILCFFYLHRPLFPPLLEALKPGGVLVYETFLIENHLRRHHPRRREFCLASNELLRLVTGLRILHYDEGAHEGAHVDEPAFTARLLAERQ